MINTHILGKDKAYPVIVKIFIKRICVLIVQDLYTWLQTEQLTAVFPVKGYSDCGNLSKGIIKLFRRSGAVKISVKVNSALIGKGIITRIFFYIVIAYSFLDIIIRNTDSLF